MGTVTHMEKFDGANAVVLENRNIGCVCLPEHGGKLASLYYKKQRFELLFQNPKQMYRIAQPGSAFGDYEACGFDDAFPNIDAGTVETAAGKQTYFDHGEIWTAKFNYERSAEELRLTYKSPFLGYRYEKLLSLRGSTLLIEYRIRNESESAFPCIWACHCLVNYRTDMQLIFPDDVERVLNVANTKRLGSTGTIYRFPVDATTDGNVYDFTTVPPLDGKTMVKYYCCDAVQEGRCGYRYPTEGVEAIFTYDANALPYLGFWVTAGGYRGDANCALEPTNGFYDSIETAQQNGKCPVLQPNEELRFQLRITLKSLAQ